MTPWPKLISVIFGAPTRLTSQIQVGLQGQSGPLGDFQHDCKICDHSNWGANDFMFWEPHGIYIKLTRHREIWLAKGPAEMIMDGPFPWEKVEAPQILARADLRYATCKDKPKANGVDFYLFLRHRPVQHEVNWVASCPQLHRQGQASWLMFKKIYIYVCVCHADMLIWSGVPDTICGPPRAKKSKALARDMANGDGRLGAIVGSGHLPPVLLHQRAWSRQGLVGKMCAGHEGFTVAIMML